MRFLVTSALLVTFLAFTQFAQASGRVIDFLSQTDSTDDSQTYGDWQAKSPRFPHLQVRAKCDYSADSQSDSMWSFEFRNEYDHPVDFVYRYQYGLQKSRLNGMSALSQDSLAVGDIRSGLNSGLHGTCSAHPDGIHIQILCVVPQGKAADCAQYGVSLSALAKKSRNTEGTESGRQPTSRPRDPFAGTIWGCKVPGDYLGFEFDPDGQASSYVFEYKKKINPDPADRWQANGSSISWTWGAKQNSGSAILNNGKLTATLHMSWGATQESECEQNH